MHRRIAITTGDVDGIGFEVSTKALHSLGPQEGNTAAQFILFRSDKSEKKYLPLLDSKFSRKTVHSLADALKIPFDPKVLVDVELKTSPALWVKDVAEACMKKKLTALATAPLSKTEIVKAGIKSIGHTQILQKVSGSKELFMGFYGEKFSVVLATQHIPLKKVPAALTPARLTSALKACLQFRDCFLPGDTRPIGVLGLNPHAGEEGLLGNEEKKIAKWISSQKKKGVVGPLVPDAAFLESNWKNYSVYLALYHDQGLIPFKMIHGHDDGVHMSLGLPFTRTSVDHGTAKDIFGHDRARFKSMEKAIKACLTLSL